ncbi:MAG: hypothetical protein AAFV85_23210 [Cyanobacteria bacterium J06634_6]
MDSIFDRAQRCNPKGTKSLANGLYGDACYICGNTEDSKIKESKYVESSFGVKRRRRFCKSCSAGITTFEIRDDDFEQLIDLSNRLFPLIRKLDELEKLVMQPDNAELASQKLKEIQVLKNLLKRVPSHGTNQFTRSVANRNTVRPV